MIDNVIVIIQNGMVELSREGIDPKYIVIDATTYRDMLKDVDLVRTGALVPAVYQIGQPSGVFLFGILITVATRKKFTVEVVG